MKKVNRVKKSLRLALVSSEIKSDKTTLQFVLCFYTSQSETCYSFKNSRFPSEQYNFIKASRRPIILSSVHWQIKVIRTLTVMWFVGSSYTLRKRSESKNPDFNQISRIQTTCKGVVPEITCTCTCCTKLKCLNCDTGRYTCNQLLMSLVLYKQSANSCSNIF